MNVTLLTLNKPNLNNRVYTTEAIQKAIEECQWKIDERRMLVERDYDPHYYPEANVENSCGLVTKLQIEDDILIGTVEYFSQFENLIGIPIRPRAIGTIDEHGIVHDVKFISFFQTNDPA